MSYIDLIAWKESYRLAKLIYQLTELFPSSERYGMTSQPPRSFIK